MLLIYCVYRLFKNVPSHFLGRGCDIICVFTYVNLQLLLLLSFILVVYTSIEVDDNSDHNITLSTSEAFSLTEWANYSMNLYSKQVCIERLKKNELNELTEKRVTVHMEKRECYPDRNKIINRMIKNVFESTSSQNARLDFFWIKDTKLQFFIDITSDAIPGEELTAYILDAEGHGLKIECDTFYNNSNRQYVFPFSGSSSHVNVTCSLENNTSKCYSTPYAISKTRRYYVCMRFSAANIKANVSYSIHINETTYDLTNSFSKPCPLNMSDCCLSYRNILVEIFNPTCVFIKNEAVGHHNQAKELPFPLTIATESKWDGTLYSGILGAASLLFSMTIIFCRVCCYLYRRTHPDEYCLEIRCAPAKIHLHV